MKKGLRITLAAAAACLIVLVYLVIHGLNERRIGQLTCAGVRVEFADNLTFVTAKDVEGYLSKGYGNYLGQRLDSVDLAKVCKNRWNGYRRGCKAVRRRNRYRRRGRRDDKTCKT